MTAVCMIYGATGYMGRLVLDAALARGLRPVIAGRNEVALRALAGKHRLPFRIFALDEPAAMTAALEQADVVLNAAGPLSNTASRLAAACIAEGVHYLDIGCELAVLERLAALDETAREAGVTVLPGVGFSPAVGEALARHLKRRLPRAVKLEIAVSHLLPPTPGLIRAGLAIGQRPARALRRGRVKTMPRRRVRRFDFGRGPVRCYRLGWGELAAMHRATGVRNIDFFVQRRRDLAALMRMSAVGAVFRRLPPLRKRLDDWAGAQAPGPAPGRHKQGRTHLTGHAFDPEGQRAVTRLHLPDPYTVTAELAVSALIRAMEGPAKPGVLTATQYLGTDFLGECPGLHIDWEELEINAPGELPLRVKRRLPWWRRLIPWRSAGTRLTEPASPVRTDDTPAAPTEGPDTVVLSGADDPGTEPDPPAGNGKTTEAPVQPTAPVEPLPEAAGDENAEEPEETARRTATG